MNAPFVPFVKFVTSDFISLPFFAEVNSIKHVYHPVSKKRNNYAYLIYYCCCYIGMGIDISSLYTARVALVIGFKLKSIT